MNESEGEAGGAPGAEAATDAGAQAELERVRAERDALQEEVEALAHPRQGKIRGFFVGLLVVITCIAMLGSVVGVWASRSALNTSVFEKRTAPLASDPRVQTALAAYITSEVMKTIDTKKIFQEALPDEASILATPLSSVIEQFVQEQVEKVLATDAFAKLWDTTLTNAQRAAVDLIEDKSGAVETDGDTLVINMVPIINSVLAQIGEESPEIFGQTVDIPTVTIDEIPEDAVKKLEDTLGITLPDNYGTIRVDDAGGALSITREVVQIVNFAVWISVILMVVCLGLALWISHQRRRTVLQLCGGLILTLFIFRRVAYQVESDALDLVKDDTNRDAADAVLSGFLDPLFSGTSFIIWLLVIVAAVALLTGPYAWAGRFRTWAGQLASTVVAAAGSMREKEGQDEAVQWVLRNLTALQIAGGVVGLVLLAWLDLSFFWLLVLILIVGGYEYVLWRIGDQFGEGADDDQGDDEQGDGGQRASDTPPSADPTTVSP